ncbi:MAG: pitrilysin family protein [bacterium]
MRRYLFAFLSLLFSFSTLAVAGEKGKEFKIPYEKYKLANGLNVILHMDKSDPIASIYVCYHVGSNRETKGHTGFAHLFEHIMFQESQHIPQDQFFKKIQGAGGTLNGSTNNDRTNYYETVPKNALEMALWMEADRMGFLLSKLTQEAFENQQNVVQNEKRQNYDNRPLGNSGYVLSKLLYPDIHPYNWQVIGSLDDLGNASLQDVIDFYRKYYGPQNATLVVAGDLDVPQTKKWIEKYFGEIKGGAKAQSLSKMPVTLTETKKAYYEDDLTNSNSFTMAFPTVEEYNKDSYALRYLGQLLASGKKSPMYRVLVDEKKLTPSMGGGGGGRGMGGGGGGAMNRSMELSGSFNISVQPYPDKNLTDVESAVKEAFELFEKERFTDKDLERLKTGIELQFYNSIAGVAGKASRLGDLNEYAGSPDFLNSDLNNSLNVTKEDIWRVYNQYIKGKNYVVLSIVPTGKSNLVVQGSTLFVIPEESISRQGTAKKSATSVKVEPTPTKFDRSKEPPKGSNPAVTIPKIWTANTKNGIKIYGITHKELPLVQFSVSLKGGMMLDPKDKIGTSSLTARLMNEGTKTKTPVELRETMQDLGVSVSMSSGEETFTVSSSCLANKLADAVALAKEMMFEPRWDEKEFALAKRQTMESFKRSESSPASIATRVFDKLVYGADHILASSASGTAKSIESITIDDLKNYYNNYFSPSVAKIMVVGDITKEKAVAMFDALKDWQAKEVKIPKISVEPSKMKPGIYFVDVPNAKQSEFRVGHLGLARTNSDYYKAVVMNYHLGGNFNGILNMILREEKGYTYGARSSFSGTTNPGTFQASSSIQGNATLETSKIIHSEIDKYRQGISPENLALVKSTILNGEALNYETIRQLAGMLSLIVQYDLPFDYVKKQQEIVKNMSTSEHKALSEKYLLPDKMIYLIVGDKATQFDKLKEVGLGTPILLDKEGKPVAQ